MSSVYQTNPSPSSRPLPQPNLYETQRKKKLQASASLFYNPVSNFNSNSTASLNQSSLMSNSKTETPFYNDDFRPRAGSYVSVNPTLETMFPSPIFSSNQISPEVSLTYNSKIMPEEDSEYSDSEHNISIHELYSVSPSDNRMIPPPRPRKNSFSAPLRIEEMELLLSNKQKNLEKVSSELSKAQFHVTDLNKQLNESKTMHKDSLEKLKNITRRCIQVEKNNQEIKQELASKQDSYLKLEQNNLNLILKNKELEKNYEELSYKLSNLESKYSKELKIKEKELWSQTKEKIEFSKCELESVLVCAKEGINKLLEGVDNAKRLNNILNSLDKAYELK